MADFLPPVVVTLLMNNAEFLASADESKVAMGELAATSETTAAKIDAAGSSTLARGGAATSLYTSGVKKMTTAVIGAGVAFVAFGVDKAIKLQDALDVLKNQTNASATEIDHIKTATIALSNQTGKSAIDIVGAYQSVEAAGYKRIKADQEVNAATKLAVISGQSATVATQELVAAQELGITRGLSAAKVADILSIALRGNQQGFQGVAALLQGKVGASFAAYHQSAGEAVSIANVLSTAHYSNTRALSSLVNKLGEFNTSMTDTTVTNGKVTESTAGWVNSLLNAGLSVDKTKFAFTGPDGLVNGLKYLQTVAHGSLGTLNRDLQAVFGTAGAPLAQLLLKNIGQISSTTTATNRASGAGLNTAFVTATHQFGTELGIVWQRFVNVAAGFGLALIPSLQKALDFVARGLTSLQNNPKERAAIEISLGAAFAASVGLKLEGLLNKSVQTTLLGDIATNTSLLVKEGFGGGGGGGIVGDFEKGGKAAFLTTMAQAVAVGVAAGFTAAAIKSISQNPNASAAARGNYEGAVFKNNGNQILSPQQIAKLNLHSQVTMIDGAAVTINPSSLKTNIPGLGGGGASILPGTKPKTLRITHKTSVGFHK